MVSVANTFRMGQRSGWPMASVWPTVRTGPLWLGWASVHKPCAVPSPLSPLTPCVRSAGPARRAASTSAPSRLCRNTSSPRPTSAACASASSICRCAARPSAPSGPTNPPFPTCTSATTYAAPPAPRPPPLQLKRYNKSRLDHDAHAVAAESLLLLKSSPPHNAAAMGAAVDPVHPKPSALSQVRATRHLSVLPCSAPARPHTAAPVVHPWWQLASAPDLHRNVQLALERWPNRPVAPEPSRQVDAVRRVKAQLLTSGSLPRGEVVCLGTAAPPGETAVLTPCYLSYISRY